jgi:hypothetical protein
MRLQAPATRVPMRLVPLVAVWTVPLTGRPCICQQRRRDDAQNVYHLPCLR